MAIYKPRNEAPCEHPSIEPARYLLKAMPIHFRLPIDFIHYSLDIVVQLRTIILILGMSTLAIPIVLIGINVSS